MDGRWPVWFCRLSSCGENRLSWGVGLPASALVIFLRDLCSSTEDDDVASPVPVLH